eukprot:gnl/TRDRNA2_/TRDRNA2_141928_c0_seq1.p1 gnl/TRDRNA2_/TRDRNA2_141928_c0~~gnl/TRDRNA2_/TRDRNA2_141928_c0_seq1.p1  ORF type:complete len:104 (+),score=5.33 gnl/TRDRNA2_/TRDRNA2_141928_c0_seq1:35-313(+)
MDVYDSKGNTWEERASMHNERYGPSGIIAGNSIYVMGGVKYVNGENQCLSTAERYSIAEDAWEMIESIPASQPYQLMFATAVALRTANAVGS